jgi:hypothetical protein
MIARGFISPRCGLADTVRSDLYRDLLPLVNSGRVELLDHPRLVAQLCALERRTARSGKDSTDHGPGVLDAQATTRPSCREIRRVTAACCGHKCAL